MKNLFKWRKFINFLPIEYAYKWKKIGKKTTDLKLVKQYRVRIKNA